jgi:maltose alpha-D-glucosyltransferase / alpha-amylase
MDAVPFVIAQKGAKVSKPQEQYDMLRTFSQFLNWREGEAIILRGEPAPLLCHGQ